MLGLREMYRLHRNEGLWGRGLEEGSPLRVYKEALGCWCAGAGCRWPPGTEARKLCHHSLL